MEPRRGHYRSSFPLHTGVSGEFLQEHKQRQPMVQEPRGHNCPSVLSSVCRVLGNGSALSCHKDLEEGLRRNKS